MTCANDTGDGGRGTGVRKDISPVPRSLSPVPCPLYFARMLPAGTMLGPYRIVDALGAGGMGEVYRAHDTRLGRDVAVKVLSRSLTHDPDSLRRFEQEARAAGMLNHPNILAIFALC